MPLSPARAHLRAKIAGLTRDRDPNDPELVAARRELGYETLAEHVRKIVSDWPPLTDDQRSRLTVLLAEPSTPDGEVADGAA